MAGNFMDAVIPALQQGAQATDVTNGDLEGDLRMVEGAIADAHAVGRGTAWNADAMVSQEWVAESRRLIQMCGDLGVGVRQAAAFDMEADEMGAQGIRAAM